MRSENEECGKIAKSSQSLSQKETRNSSWCGRVQVALPRKQLQATFNLQSPQKYTLVGEEFSVEPTQFFNVASIHENAARENPSFLLNQRKESRGEPVGCRIQ
jgi:hypothetical protein